MSTKKYEIIAKLYYTHGYELLKGIVMNVNRKKQENLVKGSKFL